MKELIMFVWRKINRNHGKMKQISYITSKGLPDIDSWSRNDFSLALYVCKAHAFSAIIVLKCSIRKLKQK